jgi:hypothetical protein
LAKANFPNDNDNDEAEVVERPALWNKSTSRPQELTIGISSIFPLRSCRNADLPGLGDVIQGTRRRLEGGGEDFLEQKRKRL